MDKLVLHPTDTAQWQALLNDAQAARNCVLNEEVESYLVFLLMRFAARPDVVGSVLAMDFLGVGDLLGQERCNKLKDIGDKSLLFSGLFPGLAERKRVKISYFIGMGRTAYANMSHYTDPSATDLYACLSQDFVLIMDVLQATRDVSIQTASPTFAAFKLWQETGDPQALLSVQKKLDQFIIDDPDARKRKH